MSEEELLRMAEDGVTASEPLLWEEDFSSLGQVPEMEA